LERIQKKLQYQQLTASSELDKFRKASELREKFMREKSQELEARLNAVQEKLFAMVTLSHPFPPLCINLCLIIIFL